MSGRAVRSWYTPPHMKIVANPTAGYGKGASCIEQLGMLPRARDIEVIPTTHPGHAGQIARACADAGELRLGVMGGDGTIHEVAGSLAGSATELVIISVGTGNDVARSLGLPCNDLEASLRVLEHGRPKPVDLGCAEGHYFISVMGVGFPALVAAQSHQLKWLPGSLAFPVAVYKAMWRMRLFPVEIVLDDQEVRVDCTSIMVLNTAFTGGGLKMAPDARVDDGLFDVVVIDSIGKVSLMVNFPRVYSGTHLEHPRFTLYRSSTIQIRTRAPVEKMFDGDSCGATPVSAHVVPGALRILHPVE